MVISKIIWSGPFRINFSKSGISYSVGVKGGRVSVGPRGTYVNLSSHGISYRQKISGGSASPSPAVPQMSPTVYAGDVHNIASADVTQLSDTDSKAFISELTKKAEQIAYSKWFGVFPLVVFLFIMAFTSFSSRTVVTQPATDSIFAKVTFYPGVNIRPDSGLFSNQFIEKLRRIGNLGEKNTIF
jgi:hypothetical protein